MDETIKEENYKITKDLFTIDKNSSKIIKDKKHNYKRLYTLSEINRNSSFQIKKLCKTTQILGDVLLNKSNMASPNHKKIKKKITDLELTTLPKTLYGNNKTIEIKSNVISTDNKENEQDEKLQKLNEKIKEIYNIYHKTYGNNSLGNLSRNKEKIFLKPVNAKSTSNKENKNFDIENKLSKINNNITSFKYLTKNNSSKKHMSIANNKNIKYNNSANSLFNIYRRNYLLSKTQKYNHRYSRNKIKSFSQKRNNYFMQSHKIKLDNKKKSKSGNIVQLNNFYTENDNKTNNNKLRRNNEILHRRVSSLIKELNIKRNSLLLLFKDEENKENASKKSSKELSKSRIKEARHKLLSLLNKKEYDFLNFSSKRRILRSENPIIKKPTNNLEMNQLIINSFGVGFNHSEYAQKIYNLNETFFSLLENMKQRRAEMDIAKFEREKNKYLKKEDQKINYEIFFQKSYRDKWERKFMLNQYKYKIPEKEFKKFKKYKQQQLKKKIIKDSQKLSDLLTKMDAEEYELPEVISKHYKSTGNFISPKNIKRIYRVQKILKNIEDDEQTGEVIINVDKLKKEQKKIEEELISSIKDTGKPRFVKNVFKTKTILKFKGITGDYFGLPA